MNQQNNTHPQTAIDEKTLQSLCRKYKHEIATGQTAHLPSIRIRYVIDRDRFGYAQFGDFFFSDFGGEYQESLYVWMTDSKYADSHNPDMTEDVLGDDITRQGYAVHMIFAGVDTGISDSNGQHLYTGDVVSIGNKTDTLALSTLPDNDGNPSCYGFPLDGGSLTLDMCKEEGRSLTRVGTVFYQLDWDYEPETVRNLALEYNSQLRDKETAKNNLRKSRLTPNFDKEEWKYYALDIFGAEFNWDK